MLNPIPRSKQGSIVHYLRHPLPAQRERFTLAAWAGILCVDAITALQFVRYYARSTTFYLDLNAYLTGHERLPFQERVLPILFLRCFRSLPLLQSLEHKDGAFTHETGAFYLLSLLSLVVAALYTQRLYGLLTRYRSLAFLVYPVFLFTVMWTYTIHSEANYSYPYDLPSLAFFTAGLYYIYRRSFLGIFVVMLLGTFNRETTLFLIGIYVIDAAAPPTISLLGRTRSRVRDSFNLSLVPWLRVALLAAVWVAIKGSLAYTFRHNDRSEDFLRIGYNMARMKLRLLPAMLNLCGYILPIVILFGGALRPRRFANYLFIVIPWGIIMFCSGVLLETRIYGELCSFSSVALVLIIEQAVDTHYKRLRLSQPLQPNEELPLSASSS